MNDHPHKPGEPAIREPPSWVPLRGQELLGARLRRIRELAAELAAELSKVGGDR